MLKELLQYIGKKTNLYLFCEVESKEKHIGPNGLSLWLRWNVAVRGEAAGVYQQSDDATERDSETYRQSCTKFEGSKMKSLRQAFLYLKAVFSTVNIYSFLITIKLLTKTA